MAALLGRVAEWLKAPDSKLKNQDFPVFLPFADFIKGPLPLAILHLTISDVVPFLLKKSPPVSDPRSNGDRRRSIADQIKIHAFPKKFRKSRNLSKCQVALTWRM